MKLEAARTEEAFGKKDQPKYWTLAEASRVPFSPLEEFLGGERVLVVSPHPDDESLGCGGLIALLRAKNVSVEIAWMTDGGASHPNSVLFPRAKLANLRRGEAIRAAELLGVTDLHFFDLPDAQMPFPPAAAIVDRLSSLISRCPIVLTPWRLDPHGDHRLTFAYLEQASRGLSVSLLEYPVWVWQNGEKSDLPEHDRFTILRLDITPVLAQKKAAIAAHQSQMSSFISDDPEGFQLPSALLAHFEQPWEIYVRSR